MATIPIEIGTLTYTGKEPDTVGAVIKRGVFNGLDLADLGLNLREDVVVREKMYMASMKEFITRKRIGCGEKTNSGNLVVIEKFLDVVNLQIWDQICAEDFGGTFFELARKKGFDVNNLQDTEIETLIEDLYTGVWKRDMLSIVQFGDTTISPGTAVADPGQAGTPTEKAAYEAYKKKLTLSVLDGFWKLVFDAVALKGTDDSDPDGIIRGVTIPQTGALPANYTRDTLLPGLYNSQSDLMDQVDDSEKLFVLSRELYTNLEASNRQFATAGERAYDIYRNGEGELMFNGIRIVKNKMIEQKALTPYASGDPRTFKRRAYLIVKDGFQVGTDTYQDSQVMEAWYSKDFDLNNIRIRYKLGIQYLDGDVLVVAF
jgi:hypothetical protein